MSVTNVINRINDIQRQFGAAAAPSGYPAASGKVTAAGSADAVTEDGVIVGRMGGEAPTVASVTSQQANLTSQPIGSTSSPANIDNLSSPLPGIDIVSAYGERLHPIHGDVRMHHGVDLDA
ncbi:MAG: hypothetical protein P8N02_13890, partial [Actinomycetota bacterium]|nr:hypothetical protein [Actinomycetota bacterium]